MDGHIDGMNGWTDDPVGGMDELGVGETGGVKVGQ